MAKGTGTADLMAAASAFLLWINIHPDVRQR